MVLHSGFLPLHCYHVIQGFLLLLLFHFVGLVTQDQLQNRTDYETVLKILLHTNNCSSHLCYLVVNRSALRQKESVCKLKVKKKIKHLIFLYTGNLKTNTVLENISSLTEDTFERLINLHDVVGTHNCIYIRDQNSLSCRNYTCRFA